MKSISHHIEHVKGKPHHIRKQVAFSAAGALTALIGLVWLVGSLSTGAFALKSTSFADAGSADATLTAKNSVSGGIAGAAAALSGETGPARIEIVDAASSTRNTKKAEQTTIPF